MNIMMGEKIWHESTKSLMPEYVRVIGRVIGKVFIKDLNKTVAYNTVLDILSTDAQVSKDLQNAIQSKWVDVVYGKEFLQKPKLYTTDTTERIIPQTIKQPQSQPQQMVNIDELKNYVTNETQRAVAALGVTVNQVLDEIKRLHGTNSQQNITIDQNFANTIAQQIIQNLPTNGKISSANGETDKVAESVFINVDENRELKTNIKTGELGEVTKLKDKKAKSIASKLKNIRREGD